jgi:hypothetical protein
MTVRLVRVINGVVLGVVLVFLWFSSGRLSNDVGIKHAIHAQNRSIKPAIPGVKCGRVTDAGYSLCGI